MSERDPPGQAKQPLRKAVALHYDGEGAPRITASGGGFIAQRILDIAEEYSVPIHEDPELTAVLAQIPVGEEVPEELYIAVAEVLAFIYQLSGREPDWMRKHAEDLAKSESKRSESSSLGGNIK